MTNNTQRLLLKMNVFFFPYKVWLVLCLFMALDLSKGFAYYLSACFGWAVMLLGYKLITYPFMSAKRERQFQTAWAILDDKPKDPEP